MKRICVVITARASFARVQTVLEHLFGKDCMLYVILAGSAVQHKYGHVAWHPLIDKIAHDSSRLTSVWECSATEPVNLAATALYTGQLIIELTTILNNTNPDRVVVIGDRYETVAVSLAAKYLGIPLAHLLAGERSGNIDDTVRQVNTTLADRWFCPTTEAQSLLRQHAPDIETPERMHFTGCPSVDLALRARRPTPEQLNKHGIGAPVTGGTYLVGMYHPTPVDDPALFSEVFTAALAYAAEADKQVFWFWPNIDPDTHVTKALRQAHEQFPQHFRLFRHLDAEDFLGLLKGADCLIGNSSVGVREASAIGVPVLNIGVRQAGRECAENVQHFERITDLKTYRRLLKDVLEQKATQPWYVPSTLYGDGTAGKQIAEILLNE